MPSYSRVAWTSIVPALASRGRGSHRSGRRRRRAPAPIRQQRGAERARQRGDTGTRRRIGRDPNPPPARPPSRHDTANKNQPDVDSLRQEYLALRDELFKSRARANAVASALYSTRIQIKLTWTSARYYSVAKAQVRLDGATVYEDASRGDRRRRWRALRRLRRAGPTSRDVPRRGDRQRRRRVHSTTESQIAVKAVREKDLDRRGQGARLGRHRVRVEAVGARQLRAGHRRLGAASPRRRSRPEGRRNETRARLSRSGYSRSGSGTAQRRMPRRSSAGAAPATPAAAPAPDDRSRSTSARSPR